MAASRIEGKEWLIAKLKRLPSVARDAMIDANVKSAQELVAMQQRLVPVDKGNLQRSIKYDIVGEGLIVEVSAGGTAATRREVRKDSGVFLDEALLVEFGAKAHEAGGKFKGADIPAQPARPFFFPAFRSMKRSAKSRYSRSVNKAVKQIAQR